MSAGVQCRGAARRQAPSARIAAFNGVVSDRVAGVSGNSMFQVKVCDGLYHASLGSQPRNRILESILDLNTPAHALMPKQFGLTDSCPF